jgi:hypothetical protein
MRLTPVRLIVFRTFNVTLGRFRFWDVLLRRVLLRIMVRKAAVPYVQSSRFYSPDELG